MKGNETIHANESVLIASTTRGDLEAFNDMVLKYQDLVYNATPGPASPDASCLLADSDLLAVPSQEGQAFSVFFG